MFRIFQENKDIKWLIQQKEYINFSPSYQRMGGIWNKRQKQMLIDSILNGFDIPKIYFTIPTPCVKIITNKRKKSCNTNT